MGYRERKQKKKEEEEEEEEQPETTNKRIPDQKKFESRFQGFLVKKLASHKRAEFGTDADSLVLANICLLRDRLGKPDRVD